MAHEPFSKDEPLGPLVGSAGNTEGSYAFGGSTVSGGSGSKQISGADLQRQMYTGSGGRTSGNINRRPPVSRDSKVNTGGGNRQLSGAELQEQMYTGGGNRQLSGAELQEQMYTGKNGELNDKILQKNARGGGYTGAVSSGGYTGAVSSGGGGAPSIVQVSADQVRDVFKFLGLNPSDEKANRITGEINSGKRTLIDVRNDIMKWQGKQSGESIEQVAEGYVRNIFKEEGAAIATGSETEEKRLKRLVGEVLEGHDEGNLEKGRTFDSIRKGIRSGGGTPNPVVGDSSETTPVVSVNGKGAIAPAVQPSASQLKDVRGVFNFLGLSADEKRVERIAGEVANGKRSLHDVRNDLMQYQAKQSGQTIQQVAEGYIRDIFKEEGAAIATNTETEEKRLKRLVGEVLEGHDEGNLEKGRTFGDIRQSIRESKVESAVADAVEKTPKPVSGSGSGSDPESKKPKPGAVVASTADEVKGVFKFLGLSVTDERAKGIAGEIDSGKRNLFDVRNDLMQYQASQSGKTIEQVAEGYVRNIFKEEGAAIATGSETEEKRLKRLVGEVLESTSGDFDYGREFADIRRGIKGLSSNYSAGGGDDIVTGGNPTSGTIIADGR